MKHVVSLVFRRFATSISPNSLTLQKRTKGNGELTGFGTSQLRDDYSPSLAVFLVTRCCEYLVYECLSGNRISPFDCSVARSTFIRLYQMPNQKFKRIKQKSFQDNTISKNHHKSVLSPLYIFFLLLNLCLFEDSGKFFEQKINIFIIFCFCFVFCFQISGHA